MLRKVKKEFVRFGNRVFRSGAKDKQLEEFRNKLENLPYEIYDKISREGMSVEVPTIKSVEETLDKILTDRCSFARFGDGEFGIMNGSRIHFQGRSAEMAQRLKEVVRSTHTDLLIGLPDCFGSLDHCIDSARDFWRKWMVKKRQRVYSCLDMERVYYNAFFSRVYMIFHKTGAHYQNCQAYFENIKMIWSGRDVVICEGEGTRFGMFNDLLEGASSVSRILCPARSAFDKYDEILSAFDDISSDKLVLIALGPTATVLAHDLCHKGYQAIDIGHLDVEYEWFLRKETVGVPLEFKYVDGTDEGRKVHPLEDAEYERQILATIV